MQRLTAYKKASAISVIYRYLGHLRFKFLFINIYII